MKGTSMGKAKLTTLKPLVQTLAPRLGYAPGDERQRSRYRDRTEHWQRWYKSKRWQRMRWEALVRDSFTCRKCGRTADRKVVADHIVPHKGNPKLFWDPDNLQCLCG